VRVSAGVLRVVVNGKAVAYTPPFNSTDRFYFKAGDYNQCKPCGHAGQFAEVHLAALVSIYQSFLESWTLFHGSLTLKNLCSCAEHHTQQHETTQARQSSTRPDWTFDDQEPFLCGWHYSTCFICCCELPAGDQWRLVCGHVWRRFRGRGQRWSGGSHCSAASRTGCVGRTYNRPEKPLHEHTLGHNSALCIREPSHRAFGGCIPPRQKGSSVPAGILAQCDGGRRAHLLLGERLAQGESVIK
jgi:hypothetical protein